MTTYTAVITKYPEDMIFLSMFRHDEKRMTYEEIQYVKSASIGDVLCVMLYPDSKLNIDNANVYHLIHDPKYVAPIMLQDIENLPYISIDINEINKEDE